MSWILLPIFLCTSLPKKSTSKTHFQRYFSLGFQSGIIRGYNCYTGGWDKDEMAGKISVGEDLNVLRHWLLLFNFKTVLKAQFHLLRYYSIMISLSSWYWFVWLIVWDLQSPQDSKFTHDLCTLEYSRCALWIICVSTLIHRLFIMHIYYILTCIDHVLDVPLLGTHQCSKYAKSGGLLRKIRMSAKFEKRGSILA